MDKIETVGFLLLINRAYILHGMKTTILKFI